ncbi:MAG: hypothetical protein ACO1RX_04380 [Candidatus Sericytochromatia bacterium]
MRYTLLSPPPRVKLRVQLPLDSPGSADTAVMRAAVREVLAEKKWVPAREPRLTPQGAQQFLCELELFPEVTLPPLPPELEVPPLAAPQEAELLAALEALQVRLGEQLPAPRADWGQLLVVDLVGRCQGEIIPLSVQQHVPLLLLKNHAQAAALEALVGLKPGEQAVFEQPLPASFPHLPWRGALAHYTVYVHSCSALRVPAADDALAQACGAGARLDDLLGVLHEQLRQENRARWRQRVRDRLVGMLVAAARVEVPEAWVHEQLQALWSESDGRLLPTLALKLAPAEVASSWRTWQGQPWLRQQQQRNLKTRLVLRQLGLQAGIEVDAESLLRPLQVRESLLPEAQALPWQERWQQVQQEGLAQAYADQVWLDRVVTWLVGQVRLSAQGETLTTS